MCHTSPAVELVWTILSATLFVYLVSHLYNFDRFKCLRMWGGEHKGAFKKVMTISYLLAVPLLFIRSLIMAIIKYNEGYMLAPGIGIIPTPWAFWPESYQRLILPAQLCWAIAWALEWVSHLEELCFWLFLTNPDKLHMRWFGSINFWVWAAGSVIGLGLMPFVAVYKRADPLESEAWIVLTGSVGSTLITLVFFRVLWIFPGFLKRVRTEGAGQDVVTRLVTFHKINIMRVCFRLLFCLPLLVLGIDGVRPTHEVNVRTFWVDLLAVTGGIGCMVSSIMTLLVFFPRSMNREAGYDSRHRSNGSQYASKNNYNSPNVDAANPFATDPGKHTRTIEYKNSMWEMEESARMDQMKVPLQFRYPPPNPKKKRSSAIHPLILNYRSPIDVMDDEQAGLLPNRV